MNMFIRSHAGFKIEADKAKAILRKAKVVASDETGVRIEGPTLITGCSTARMRSCTSPIIRAPPASWKRR